MAKAKKKSSKKTSYKHSSFWYDKKNWQMWVIVYGGIALVLYGTLYLFTMGK